FVLTIYLASFLGALGAAAAVAFSSCFIGCLTSILGCRLYNTVLSIARTVMGAAGIIIICLMNTIVFNDVFTRSVICIACLIIELIIYRKQIYSIVSNIKSPSI
ncbi:MAG: hypothetical protein RR505_07840, partial [Raoultibacter sp.]